jgi:hypothetical protein
VLQDVPLFIYRKDVGEFELLNPGIGRRCLVVRNVAGVNRTGHFDEQRLAFGWSGRFMFFALRNYEHFPGLDRHVSVSEMDAHRAIENNENLIRVTVVMPYEFTFKLHKLEVMVIHMRDDFRRPVFGKLG